MTDNSEFTKAWSPEEVMQKFANLNIKATKTEKPKKTQYEYILDHIEKYFLNLKQLNGIDPSKSEQENAVAFQNFMSELEIEGRLGIFDGEKGKFDSNIGEENYYSIMNLLKNNDKFKVETTESTDYFVNLGGKSVRVSVPFIGPETAPNSIIEKERLEDFTYINENGVLDMRISFSLEKTKKQKMPVHINPNSEKREKKRTSYILTQRFPAGENTIETKVRYDLTRVEHYIPKADTVEIYFEFEIEILNKNINEKYLVDDLIRKLLDCEQACENKIITNENVLDPTVFSLVEITKSMKKK